MITRSLILKTNLDDWERALMLFIFHTSAKLRFDLKPHLYTEGFYFKIEYLC